jgi:hypothetical protein
MDIKVQSVRQSEAPLEAFGSYSQQINTRSTFGDSLQRLGQNLNTIKQRKQKESDTLTADRLYSDWSAQKAIADDLLRSTDPNKVKEGKELSDSLNPDTFDFKGYAEANNITPLYNEENFVRYKNNAREHWTVQQGLYGIQEADRARAVGIKNQTNSYNQEFADKLDFENPYDKEFLKGKIDYFGGETYASTVAAGGADLEETIAFGHTGPLLEALKHQFNTAKLPSDYEDALELLEYAKDTIPAEMFNKELITTMGTAVNNAYTRVNDPNSISGQLKTVTNDITNYLGTITDNNSVVGKSAQATGTLSAIENTRAIYGNYIEKGSTTDLKLASQYEYAELYRIDEEGSSAFHASVIATLLKEDPGYDGLLINLQDSHKSKFKDDVATFVREFTTQAEAGNPNALAMLDPEYAKNLEAYKSGKINSSQLRVSYKSASEFAKSIPGLSIPQFYTKNRNIEEFPPAQNITERRSYIEEIIDNNDLVGIDIASKAEGVSADEQIMLKYAHFQLVSGRSKEDILDTTEWWATALADDDYEHGKKINDIVQEMLDNPDTDKSEMFNLYRVHRMANKIEEADTYLKGFKALLNEAYIANPGKSQKDILKYVRALEKNKLTGEGVFRNLNGRDTFVPRELLEHIDPNMDPMLFMSGPTQLITGKLTMDNGLRAVEAAAFVEAADQMVTIMPETFEQVIMKSPQLINEFMPDLYDTMTEEEKADLLQMQQEYAMTGVASMGPSMPYYSAMKNYLTEDKRKEIARGLYFNTVRIGGKDVPIAKLDYQMHETTGELGYYVRLVNMDTGKHTKYLENENKEKMFVSIRSIKGSVKHAKERHINVGLGKERETALDITADAMMTDLLVSLADAPSGLFMKDNRFMDAVLDFKEIE